MSWSTIRKATETDNEAIREAAERFCERHGINYDEEGGAEFEVDCALNPGSGCSYEQEDRAKRLRPLWRRTMRRVLGSPHADGIAYGYVGYHVD